MRINDYSSIELPKAISLMPKMMYVRQNSRSSLR